MTRWLVFLALLLSGCTTHSWHGRRWSCTGPGGPFRYCGGHHHPNPDLCESPEHDR